MIEALAAHVGYAIHGDWTYPGEPRAGNVRVAIEVQGKWYTVGVMATPSRTKEAYVYAGACAHLHRRAFRVPAYAGGRDVL